MNLRPWIAALGLIGILVLTPMAQAEGSSLKERTLQAEFETAIMLDDQITSQYESVNEQVVSENLTVTPPI